MAKQTDPPKAKRQQDYFSHTWVRCAEAEDIENITKLCNSQTRELFGHVSIKNLVNKRFITLVLEDWKDNDKLIGAITLEGHPNLLAVPSWDWHNWIYNIYRISSITPWNTLFIHLMVWDDAYKKSFLSPLLKAAFWRFNYLEFIIMVMPPSHYRVDWMERYGHRLIPYGIASDPKKIQNLYLMVRDKFMTRYKIRMAVVEDNDDLVPLIHTQCTRLKEVYGDYYIAEILLKEESQNNRRIIVAEHEGHAVAVLSINLDVNIETLNEQFELLPFRGLGKNEVTVESESDDEYDFGVSLSAEYTTRNIEEQESNSDNSGDNDKNPVEDAVPSDEEFDIVGLEMDLADAASTESSSLQSQSLFSAHMLTQDYSSRRSASTIKSESVDIVDILNVAYDRKCSIRGDDIIDYDSHHRVERESNCFAMEIAAANPQHEDALEQLIEASFQCVPDRDYCVLSFPGTTANIPMFNLFVKVSPKPSCNYEHELYVLHRNAISSTMSVRWAVMDDLKVVETIATTLVKSEKTIAMFKKALESDDEKLKPFVFSNDDQIVGFALLSEMNDMEYLTTHYDTFTWIDPLSVHKGGFAMVEYFCVMAAFHIHIGFLLREVHRLSDSTALFYTLMQTDTLTAQRDRHLSSCLSHMVPIRGVDLVEMGNTLLEEKERPNKAVLRHDLPYSLYCSTLRSNGVARVTINSKIVVVGASDCGLSFLHALVLTHCPYFHAIFTNLTLVSPHGLSYQRVPNKVRDMMLVKTSHFNRRFVCMNSLRTYVNICQGVMIAIDRKDKYITLHDNRILPYDLLFLFCGEQYQIWSGINKEYPDNVFIINTETDAANALSKMRNLVTVDGQQRKYTVCVYGHELDAYCCLASLLEYGIPGENLVFVEPFPISQKQIPPHTYSLFNDKKVDDAVMEAIKKAGITVHSSFVFNKWSYNTTTGKVTAVHFQSKHHKLDIECEALFLYMAKDISKRTFLAINKAGLVYDGRLVIQPDCRTNDPCIFAAGTMTKYSRRYYADHLTHCYYNMCEIGTKLGHQVREMLITEYKHPERHYRTLRCKNEKLPTYSKPLMKYCRLPGGLRYLHVRKPGKDVPLVVALADNDYGILVVTGDTNELEEQGWFRLHINKYNTVETITCLSLTDIDKMNIYALWGKHVKLLNNLEERYSQGYIKDLFQFFREPWACALFHEKFALLEDNMKDLMSSYTEEEGNSLIEDLYRIFKENQWKPLTKQQQKELTEKFLKSEYHTRLKELLSEFLLDNMKALPMYAHHSQISDVLQGNEHSPFFKRAYKK